MKILDYFMDATNIFTHTTIYYFSHAKGSVAILGYPSTTDHIF